MRVLVACEFSGVVRDAFLARGHDAWSCDLLPSLFPGPHIQGDVLEILGHSWDLMIAHPPCTYLSSSGQPWMKGFPDRQRRAVEALEFVKSLLGAPIPRIALENPVGIISTTLRPPDQIINPYDFGDDAAKRTCLWLKNLRPLRIDPGRRHPGRVVLHRNQPVIRWANQTAAGHNNLPPSRERSLLRSLTYPGIAAAFVENWG